MSKSQGIMRNKCVRKESLMGIIYLNYTGRKGEYVKYWEEENGAEEVGSERKEIKKISRFFTNQNKIKFQIFNYNKGDVYMKEIWKMKREFPNTQWFVCLLLNTKNIYLFFVSSNINKSS